MFECRRRNRGTFCDHQGNPLPDRRGNGGLFNVNEHWWLKVQILDDNKADDPLALAREVMSLSQRRA
ncbi:hypothetical protein HBA55_25335 [Pseudomaricurvus alkylphenolicus]|jgi:hypothetical protein|uniref:hypothetical protein n=1 Tax=Pseudomaricurvus alkylphenolicus TaxID=1306991 RepID=UPI001423D506|nr:hypothetical protein [Pseudomaricurvus alkylphenolicus]NIB42956.1 hypothetical protein [Pseudomaricurvus alkylphenolicus]